MNIPANPAPADVWRAFQQLGDIVTGRRLTQVPVGTSSTAVRHYLKRVPQHWFELSPQNGSALVKEAAAPDEEFLYLIASSAVTATIWVW